MSKFGNAIKKALLFLKKNWLPVALFVIVNLSALWIGYKNLAHATYHDYVIFDVVDEVKDVAEIPKEGGEETGYNIPGDAGYSGLALYGPQVMDLMANTYRVAIHYNVEKPGYAEIYAPYEVAEDGTAGRVVASVELPAGEGVAEINFTIDTYISWAQVRVYDGGGDFSILSANIYGRRYYKDSLMFVGIFYLIQFIAILLYNYGKYRKKGNMHALELFLGGTLLACFATMPYFNRNIVIMGHDLTFHMARLQSVVEWLKNISWRHPLPRIGLDQYWGYGYCSTIMYPSFLLIPFAFLANLFVSYMAIIKILIFAINCATAYVGCYAFSRMIGDKKLGFAATSMYMLCIFRLLGIYTRASIGEIMAMIFIPLYMLAVYELLVGDDTKWSLFTIAITGLIQTHVLSVIFVALFSVIAGLLSLKKIWLEKRRIFSLFKAFGTGIGINLFFLLPFLSYKSATPDMNINLPLMGMGSTPFSQLFSIFRDASEATKYKGPYTTNGSIAISIGFIMVVGAALEAWYLWRERERLSIFQKVEIFIMSVGIICVFFACNICPWKFLLKIEAFEFLNAFQAGWRFLHVGAAAFCFVGTLGYSRFMNKNTAMVFVLVASIFGCTYFMDSLLDEDVISRDYVEANHTYIDDELYLKYGDSRDEYRDDPRDIEFAEGTQGSVSNCVETYGGLTCDITVDKDTSVIYPFIYYSGYKIWIDGVQSECFRSDKLSLLEANLSAGTHHIEIDFVEKGSWRFATIISLLSVIGTVLLGRFDRRKQKA